MVLILSLKKFKAGRNISWGRQFTVYEYINY